jgi:hypothetical protein
MSLMCAVKACKEQQGMCLHEKAILGLIIVGAIVFVMFKVY